MTPKLPPLLYAACLMLLLAPAALASGRDVPRRIHSALQELRPHPRLLLTRQRLAELKDLAATDPLLQRAVEHILREADGILGQPLPVYEKRGPRLLHVSRRVMKDVQTCGLAWRWTGEDKYARRVRDELMAVCDFEDWNPSHFLDTAEMSHAVGLGYDWLHDGLGEDDRETIRRGLIRHAMKPGVERYRRGAWWVGSAFNWNQVCNGGLSIGALALAREEPEIAREILASAVESLPTALASYEPDGAWGEGPGYWHYATRYTCWALDAMRTALGTDFGLSNRKGLSEAAFFPIHCAGPAGLLFNYADAGENARLGSLPPLLWLARRYDLRAPAAFERRMMRTRGAQPSDVIWYVPAGEEPPRPQRDRLFRGQVDVAVFRSDWGDPNALFLAVKAGYNQINHGHLDLGSFVLDALGQRWALDLGRDNYNLPGYWDGDPGGQRWSYFRLNSFSHNVPLIGREGQDPRGRSRITTFSADADRPRAVVEMTSAYADRAERVERGLALVAGRKAALVRDELVLKREARVTWGLTTDAEITVDGPAATLVKGGRRLLVRILAPEAGSWKVSSAEQEPPQKPNEGIRRLELDLPEHNGGVTIRVLLAPVWEDGAAPAVPETSLKDW